MDLNLSTVKRFGFITRSYSGVFHYTTRPLLVPPSAVGSWYVVGFACCRSLQDMSSVAVLLFSGLVPLDSDKDYQV